MASSSSTDARARRVVAGPVAVLVVTAGLAVAEPDPPPLPVPTTLADFHVSGTQVGDASTATIWTSDVCVECHGGFDETNEPFATWSGSLMALAGRDPLFFAQMTTANQDVAEVGYFCMRCHVPMSIVTGHANDSDGSTLDAIDQDGVTCHMCHAMVDPIYVSGTSPPTDETILDGLAAVPGYYGNAMFVLDPSGIRRGPYADASFAHATTPSPFFRSGDMCGTCHDVGNVAVSRQPDGTYLYNALGAPAPDEDLYAQFPLERTYTEWKLSAFANGGVDMGGRFGGDGPTVMRSCQDCHMPRAAASGCLLTPPRADLARHDFAGAAAPSLALIAEHTKDDPRVDQDAIRSGIAKAVSMLERAASLHAGPSGDRLRVRVVNETGHKLPTGHIEGRRVWVNVRFFDGAGGLLEEHGHYDSAEAHLDEESTTVFEMKVGLSEAAAAATGLPAGVTTHMALADTIVSDNRIPPRGFNNTAYEAAGAPAVGEVYADGQHWHDSYFDVPAGAARVGVNLYYQSLPRHYVEALRDGNVSDDWGTTLYDLWLATDKAPPIEMVALELDGPVFGDDFEDGSVAAWAAVVPR